MENCIIKAENLSFSYEDTETEGVLAKTQPPALDNVSVSIRKGEYIAVLGHNGSGKSTFAKLLNMILEPSAGKVLIYGRDITAEDFTEDDMFDLRSKIGMVFQNPDNQLVATIVEEDVAFGPENLGIERSEIRKRVDEALETVGMTEYARHAPHKLSGGQKQRVAIAGVIAMKPDVIILDESTAMLDPIGRREVLGIVEKLNREENITVINITHYMEEAARADRVIVINDGRLLLDGTAKEIFSKVDFLHSIGLESPQGTELIHSLIKEGYSLSPDAITEEECLLEILKLVKGEGYYV